MDEIAEQYEPFTVGERLRVIPPGRVPSFDGRIDIIMARGAFGSGEHETTRSCLEILERLPSMEGRSVLDLGSGTAILAIAALKLGADRAVCVDFDPEAVASAWANCAINGISDQIEHVTGVLDDLGPGRFDLVLANLYGDILLDVGEALVARARPEGIILLSGILWEYNFDLRRLLERDGCRVVENHYLDSYSTILATGPG